MSLITRTPGGASDNSYITLTDANAKFANTLRNEQWTSYSTQQREMAIIQATGDIEQLGGPRARTSAKRPRFAGAPHDSDIDNQALHFPRTDDSDNTGDFVIPEGVEIAVCEQAFWLLNENANPQLVNFIELADNGVKNISLDGISASMQVTDRPSNIAPLAWRAIKPFLVKVFPVN